MNLQQLHYIVAVDTYRHFVKAAQSCHVTQPALSGMVQSLETELGVKIFDRSKHPVMPTPIGQKIIEQARTVVREAAKIKDIAQDMAAPISGDLRVGIIPTLAPYLIPLFLQRFLHKYPQVKLQISELTTKETVERIKQGQLDAGILAVPLNDPNLVEEPLFEEEFVVYASSPDLNIQKKYLLPGDLDISRLWLLDEGHCMRNQVVNLCALKISERSVHQFDLSAASIETLKKVVDMYEGITVLPYLAMYDLSPAQRNNIHFFKEPAPARKIGLVSSLYFPKEKMLKALWAEIHQSIPAEVLAHKKKQILEINVS